MYERRIENSLLRTMKEYKKQQIMRRVEQRKISEKQAIAQTEAFTGKKLNLKKQSQSSRSVFGVLRAARTNLKKQSQFIQDMMGVTPFGMDGYGDMSMLGAGQNKANLDQFDAAFGPERAPRVEKPVLEADQHSG
jgi:hypothetical protein